MYVRYSLPFPAREDGGLLRSLFLFFSTPFFILRFSLHINREALCTNLSLLNWFNVSGRYR